MRLDGRPLLDVRGDAAIYVEGPVDARVVRSLRLGLNVLVHGSHGSGRTSLARHVQWLLRQPSDEGPAPVAVHHVSASGAEDVQDALVRLLRAVAGPGNAGGSDALDMVEMLRDAVPEGGRRVLVVDDVTPTLGRALFGALRDELWTVDASWLVTCLDTDLGALTLPPVDAFFETVVPLEGFFDQQALDLVERRLRDRPEALDAIAPDVGLLASLAEGNPRRLLDHVRETAVGGRSAKSIAARVVGWADAKLALADGPRSLLSEVEARGVTGPSDPALQARMDLSRPRLLQLFATLREAGLVVQVTAPRSGPGRPALLYKAAPSAPRAAVGAGAGS